MILKFQEGGGRALFRVTKNTCQKKKMLARIFTVLRAHGAQGVGMKPMPVSNMFYRLTQNSSLQNLEQLTVVKLREQLKSLGLPVSGKKQQLIDRLRTHSADVALPSLDEKNVGEARTAKEAGTTTAATEHKPASPLRISASQRAQKDRTLHSFLVSRLRSLYRRCLRSADQCPTQEWALTLRHYVRMRFRTDPPPGSTDKLAVAISNGESELSQMELYHKARESRDLERQLEKEQNAQADAQGRAIISGDAAGIGSSNESR